MSQSLRWFSISLCYKVKLLLCNFKALQESTLAYHCSESLLFPGSGTVLPTVCIHFSWMTSYFYSQNCFQRLKYPLCSVVSTKLTFIFQVFLHSLCKFGYECFEAFLSCRYNSDVGETIIMKFTLLSFTTLYINIQSNI